MAGSRHQPLVSSSEPGSEADRPIRVLWLTKGLGRGGAEWLLVITARRLDGQAFSVRTGYLLPHKDMLVGELEAEGVAVACLGGREIYDVRWLATLRRWLMQDPVDIVHVHNPSLAVGARLVVRSLPRRLRPRVVVTYHAMWGSYGTLVRWAEAPTSRLDDARITVSQAVRASLPGFLRRRAHVVMQGIEVDEVRFHRDARERVRAELGLAPDTVVVGTVANLRPEKAYPVLLDAAREVIDKVPEVTFVAVGQGPQEDEIRAHHHRLGLGDRFVLLGYRADAVRVMSACDVFVLASHDEGLGLAVMEALALGLPVVATDVGGVPEVVRRSEGILVRPGQPRELAAALIDVVADDGRRHQMAAAAAERGDEMSIGEAVRRTESIYQDLVRG